MDRRFENFDLITQLINRDIRRKSARFAEPVPHLWHRQSSQTHIKENRQPVKNPKKVLIVVTRRIGDVVLATPFIRTLRRAWPAAQIDTLVFEKTEGPLLANPDINHIITVAEQCSLWSHIKFLSSIIRCYDIAFSIQTGDRPTFYVWMAGKYRIGMKEGPFKYWWWKQIFLDRWAPFDNINTHTVLMNLKLAELLEIDPCYEVVVPWRQEDEKRVTYSLPFDIRSESYAILHTYPKFIRKRWRQNGWVELGRWLEEKRIRVVLTGSEEEDEITYISKVSNLLSPKTVNAAGKFSLGEVAFLTSQACLYVGVDTATTHMAAALGVPTVAIYGPTNPVKWGPWPKGHTEVNPYTRKGSQIAGNVFLLQGICDSVPCEKGCSQNRNNPSKCLECLPTSLVIDAAKKVLATNRYSARTNGQAQERK